jgi:Zn-dependent protease with chaperone function
VAGLSVLVLLTGFPLLMKVIWPCSPLADAELRSAITVECGSLGQRVPQLLEWNSGGRVVNAVVTGTLPRTHCVFLSDALLKHFTHAEILAVLRHELAHARRHHILLRVVALAVPLVVCHISGVPRVAEDAYQRLVRANFAAGEWAVLTATAAGLVGYAWWVFGGFSRMLEIEADLLSCGDGHVDPDRAESAEAALYKLGCVYGLDRQTWLHPTLRTRLRILRAASRRARFAEGLRNRARWWKISMAAALALAIAAAALQSV